MGLIPEEEDLGPGSGRLVQPESNVPLQSRQEPCSYLLSGQHSKGDPAKAPLALTVTEGPLRTSGDSLPRPSITRHQIRPSFVF